MEPLYDVNLQLLSDEQLTGSWRVSGRMLSGAATETIEEATHLEMCAGNHLTLVCEGTGDQQEGSWLIQRDALLNRPYLELELPDGATRALITRLRRAPGGGPRQLTLYFQSGMELLLDCD